jgi:cobalamin biosynthesis protein CbiG
VAHYADDDCSERRKSRFPIPWLLLSRRYVDRQFKGIERHLASLELVLRQIGVTVSEATDKLDRIDSRTNDLGVLVRELKDELANQSDASPEVLRRLGVVADALDAIASDPNNPTPPVDDLSVPDEPVV